ncbi:MAG: 3-isopropylmalate dehydratase small subunit [Desulfobacteraceae bacterium]|nr:MAG: 3-isopropylmalate dehydratase small subunit [Desulfobacteraceae bacterium]
MKDFKGPVLFLDRSDINTDEIIPAKYLTENEKEALKPHLLEDLILEGFDASKDITGNRVVVTRQNFGCGSSREHAPWAFEVNGYHVVIAEGFARIFRQNMYNCGMLAIDLAASDISRLFDEFAGSGAWIEVDVSAGAIEVYALGENRDRQGEVMASIPFEMSGFDRALIESGGWVEYADSHY